MATTIADGITNPHFNYKSLNRKDLMSLSKINHNDENIRKFKQLDTNRDWSMNMYNLDINGSVPKKYGVYNHKVDFINKTDDIERSNSKILHYGLNRPQYNLTNEDIIGSCPQIVDFKSTRSTNPLEPKYKLPKFEEIPEPIPKFIRDNIEVGDIDGARPKKYFKWETRSVFKRDIEGSSPKKPYHRNTKYNYYDYSDVTKDKFQTKRNVNPLDPVYDVKYKNGENYVHGKIEGSKPVTYPPYIYPDPYNLKTLDIDGTQVGSKNYINKFTGPDYNLVVKDIRGTIAGSLKKGIVTDRKTNPLDPDYQLLGQKELGNNYNAYGKTPNSREVSIQEESKVQSKNHTSINKDRINNEENKNQDNSNRLMAPNEIFGYNDQIYVEDPINFDPENFKKPVPNYGLIHDKYLISSKTKPVKLPHELNRVPRNGSRTADLVSNNVNKTTIKTVANTMINSQSTGFTTDNNKRSYAQLLDSFIIKP